MQDMFMDKTTQGLSKESVLVLGARAVASVIEAPVVEIKAEVKPVETTAPVVNTPVQSVPTDAPRRTNAPIRIHNSMRDTSNDLVVATNPKSSFAEAIKAVKTNVLFSSVDKDVKTILVTSPEPGDGKSFMIANLAAAFAQDGKRVLVVDGDLRRGRQHNIFGIHNNPTAGYSNLILKFKNSDEQNIDSFICDTGIEGVSLIPSGPTPPNPLELLSSENNRLLIEALKAKFDVVLLDCPPALGLSDALVMSKYADVSIITVTNASTKIDQLESVKKAFDKVNSKISGVIINKAKIKGSSYSSYYADKYYSE